MEKKDGLISKENPECVEEPLGDAHTEKKNNEGNSSINQLEVDEKSSENSDGDGGVRPEVKKCSLCRLYHKVPGSFLCLSAPSQSLIMDHSDLNDIIKLITCSKRTMECVFAGFRPDSLQWSLEDEENHIMFIRFNNALHVLHICANTGTFTMRKPIILNGVEVVIDANHENKSYWYYTNSDGNQLKMLSKHLIEHFNPRSLAVELKSAFRGDYFAFIKARDLQLLRVDRYHLGLVNVSPEDIKFFLEDVKTSSLGLGVRVSDPLFRYSKGIKKEDVHLKLPHWLHFDAILNSEVKTFKLSDFSPSSSDINAFLKHWQSGGMPKLMNLECSATYAFRRVGERYDDVFDGVQLTDWDPNVTTKCININGNAKRFEVGREMVREDGKRAIVTVNIELFYPLQFTVFTTDNLVWERPTEPVNPFQFGNRRHDDVN